MDGNFSKRFVFDLQRFDDPAPAEPTITEVSTKEELTTALGNGGIVKLLADIELSEALTISKNATLDLNGHTITATTTTTPITITGGTFTLQDTSADANGKITSNGAITDTDDDPAAVVKITGSGSLNMTGGTIENTNVNPAYTVRMESGTNTISGGEIKGNYAAVRVYNSSTSLAVTGANTKITAKSTWTNFAIDNNIGEQDDGDSFGIVVRNKAALTVGTEGDTTGPTITAVAADNNTKGEAVAVSGNGSASDDNAQITILSGTLSATGGGHNNLGIYFPTQVGTLTIKGGTITGGDETYGGTGVEVRAAKEVNVTGGEIIGTGSFKATKNGNGSTSQGAGLAIAQHNTAKAINVNISGDAKVSGTVALSVTNPNNRTSNAEAIDLKVTGGEFEGTEAAVFYQDSRSELDVTDGNFKGAVVTTYKKDTTTEKFVIAQDSEEDVQDAFTVEEGGFTTTNTKVKIAGGTYNNPTIAKYTSNTSGDNKAVWDETTKTYSVVNKGAGWTARNSENKIFDYLINSGGESQTLLAVSLTSALSNAADSVSYFKADSTNRVLGVQSVSGVTASLNSDLNDTLTAKFSWLKFTTGSSNDITITPQVAGVKIIGTDIIGKATKLVTETLSAEAAASISAITVSAADNNLANISGSIGDDSIVAADKRNTTINGGAGDDIIRGGTGADSLFGGAGNDYFYYSAGKDTIADFGDQDQVILDSDSGLTPITDGSKITSTTNSFTLDFGKGNTLTFEKVNDALPTVSIASSQHYVYTKDWVMEEDKSVTLAAGVTNFDITDKIMTVDGSAATGNLTITDNANNNYIVMGGNKTTFNYKGGNDVIAGYTYDTDVVDLDTTLPTPPTSFNNVSITSSDYAISLGTSNSLTFKSASQIELTKGSDTYTYKRDRIAWEGHGITLGSEYSSKTFNGNSNANSDYATINAASVTGSLRITGNSNENLIYGGQGGGTIYGGDENDTLVAGSIGTFLNGQDGADSLVGGAGKDTFAYTGGADSIYSYEAQDLVSVASGINVAAVSVSTVNTNDLVLDFDGEKLTFVGGKDKTISLKSGRHNYLFAAESIVSDNSITLTANFTADSFAGGDAYNTINAALVEHAISITGNENDNYIVGGTSGGSLVGLAGNDTLVGGDGKDIFRYDSGKDVILGFNGTADSLSIDAPETNISKARASSRRLTFTMTDKSNTLVFRSDDSIPAQISLDGGGYLTKDGVVKDNELKLFSSAKGRIDLREDTVYSAAGITSISAENVKSQSVTLVGGADGGSFTFAGTNKKRDGFEYNGGAVSISGYESGKDRINLGDYSITGFTADDTKVAISLNGTDNAISLIGSQGDEILIHQSTNRGNSYSKMVFAQNGVVYDKAASKATNATIWSGIATGSGYSAEGTKVRKITVKDSLVSGISLGAGNNNTVIDASAAGGNMTLVSGAKNDRFIGSSNADMFVYSAGKDIIQDFNIGGATDAISLNGSGLDLDDAKISAGKKSIRFKFAGSSKNVLTVKPTKGDTLSGELTINGKDRTYSKNAIIEDKAASLTSAFGGTYKIDGVSTIDGHLVEKKLTVKGTTADETIVGGKNKTTFKGGGGTDSLVGGSGDDIFFYARGDAGTATIADFDFSNDKLKIAGGTLAKVSTIDGGVRFGMKNGKGESPEVGWFDVKTSATYDNDNPTSTNINGSQVLIKTNNTYYWFAAQDVTEEVTTEGGNGSTVTLAKAGELITWDKKVSSSDVKNHDSAVIELNYGTNLVRAGVAVAVSKDNDKATLPT